MFKRKVKRKFYSATVLILFTTSSSWSLELSRTGKYMVPTPLKHSMAASFDISDVTVSVTDKKEISGFSFKLPPELVGPNEIPFSVGSSLSPPYFAAESLLLMRGGLGEAGCTISYYQLICGITYSRSYSSSINRRAREEYLRATYTKKEDLELRLGIADVFSNDPHGLLIIEIRNNEK